LSGELAVARLSLTKQIAKRKEERKTELVETALVALDIDPSVARRVYLKSLQEEIKGKKTVKAWKTRSTSSSQRFKRLSRR